MTPISGNIIKKRSAHVPKSNKTPLPTSIKFPSQKIIPKIKNRLTIALMDPPLNMSAPFSHPDILLSTL